jgi:hypothetical protein
MPSVQGEAADRRWRPLATIETRLELDMLNPLELDRDGPLDLVIEKESPDDARERHSQLAQLPPQANCRSAEIEEGPTTMAEWTL